MYTETVIIFYSDIATDGGRGILERVRCGSDVVEMGGPFGPSRRRQIIVTLDDTDERVKLLLDELGRHDFDPSIHRWDIHTAEELAQARLLYLWGLPACQIGGELGWRKTFDLSGTCPGCYATARQTAPYLVDDEEDLQKLDGRRLVASYWGHFLVDDRLADSLMAANVTGLSFHNVYALIDKKRQVKLRWKQLQANHVLPPVAPQTTGLYQEQPCPICNRTGYHPVQREPLRLAYRASDLNGTFDVNNSWEGYGYATIEADKRPSKLSVPGMLVTPKVMRIFQDAGVTDVEYLPIRVVDQ